MKIFAIYDSKVAAFQAPVFLRTHGEAEREISAMCRDPKHHFCKYAEDYTLFDMGDFDESTGSFDILTPPRS